MKISTSTNTVIDMYGLEDGMQILADAGFEAIDYSLTEDTLPWDADYLQDPSSPEFAAHFQKIAATIRRYGLEIYQCHAPFIHSNCRDFQISVLQEHIIRSIYAAGYMNSPYIVVHALQYPEFCNGQNREKALRMSLDHFGAMAPALRETGVTMCIENVFLTKSSNQPKVPSFCSDAESLSLLIDTLNETYGPHYAACLDTGHALLVGDEPHEMLKALGHRVKVLHVQDNHRGNADEHLYPSCGVGNWKAFAEALGEAGYQGTFNFETRTPFSSLPTDLYSRNAFQQACNLLCAIGRSLTDIAEKTARATPTSF